jgi:hypothetical protein
VQKLAVEVEGQEDIMVSMAAQEGHQFMELVAAAQEVDIMGQEMFILVAQVVLLIHLHLEAVAQVAHLVAQVQQEAQETVQSVAVEVGAAVTIKLRAALVAQVEQEAHLAVVAVVEVQAKLVSEAQAALVVVEK